MRSVASPSAVHLPELGAIRSLAALRQHHRDALPQALEHAIKSQFNRRLGSSTSLLRTPLASLPLTTKEDMRAAYPFGMLAVPKSELATYHESSGTTGEPTSSYLTDADWDDIASRFARSAVNLTANDAVLVKTPYAMVTTAHQMHAAARLRGALVVPADNRSRMMSYSRVLRLLADVPITVAWCMPTEALLWQAAAQLTGGVSLPSLRAFVVAGEPLSRARRTRLEALWSARVYEDYGSTETGSLAGECPAGHLHLWADRFVPEVIDPASGIAKEVGTGLLAITTLYRKAMPLVRFVPGDLVNVTWAECSCGWALPRIRVLGRASAETGALKVSANDVDEAVFSLPQELGVLLWRARTHTHTLEVEIEIDRTHAAQAVDLLTSSLSSTLALPATALTVRAVDRGSIVPVEALQATTPFSKPRFLFADGEDWSAGLAY